jgi:hypothetical protein
VAREIVVSVNGQDTNFTFSKLSRDKLYGKKRRLPMDPEGNPCSRGSLALHGSMIIRSGMTAQGYFDDTGTQLSRRDLVGLGADGAALEKFDRTLNVSQKAEEAAPTELLNLKVSSVYILETENLDAALKDALAKGKIFSFPFNYNADYQLEKGFIIGNKNGYFALIGQMTEPDWIGHEPVRAPIVEEEWEEEDELDFDMF